MSIKRQVTIAQQTAAIVIKNSSAGKARHPHGTNSSAPNSLVPARKGTPAISRRVVPPVGLQTVMGKSVVSMYIYISICSAPTKGCLGPCVPTGSEFPAESCSVLPLGGTRLLSILFDLRHIITVDPTHGVIHFNHSLHQVTSDHLQQVNDTSNESHLLTESGWVQNSESDFVSNPSDEEPDLVCGSTSSEDASDRFENVGKGGHKNIPAPARSTSLSWADIDEEDEDYFWERSSHWKNDLRNLKPKTTQFSEIDKDDEEFWNNTLTWKTSISVSNAAGQRDVSSRRDRRDTEQVEESDSTEEFSDATSSFSQDTGTSNTSIISDEEDIDKQAAVVAKKTTGFEARVEAARQSALKHNLAVNNQHGPSRLSHVITNDSEDEVLSPVQVVNPAHAEIDVDAELIPFLACRDDRSTEAVEKAREYFAMYMLQKRSTKEMVEKHGSSREVVWRDSIVWLNCWESCAKRFPEYLDLMDEVEETRLAKVLEWWRYDAENCRSETEDQDTVYPEHDEYQAEVECDTAEAAEGPASPTPAQLEAELARMARDMEALESSLHHHSDHEEGQNCNPPGNPFADEPWSHMSPQEAFIRQDSDTSFFYWNPVTQGWHRAQVNPDGTWTAFFGEWLGVGSGIPVLYA